MVIGQIESLGSSLYLRYLRRMIFRYLGIFFGLAFIQCHTRSSDVQIQSISSPATLFAETPNWYLSAQDKLYLSWTQHVQDTIASLRYSVWQDSSWADTRLVAQGNDWFVNWADFPSITTFASSDLSVMGHFLQKSDTGRNYNYGVRLSLSRDGGETFRTTDQLHDPAPAEHGFVSLLPFSFDKVLTVWLDGRAMTGDHGHNTVLDTTAAGLAHAMQLRSAMVDFDGHVLLPQIIDDRVCECCQTDVTMTPKGPVVVYRNRTATEERDIYFSRYQAGQWSVPRAVYEDHWVIPGCPVNGPAIASFKNKLAVVWYSEAGGKPSIKLSLFNVEEDRFSPPVAIKTSYTLGRLDIVWLDDHRVAVSFVNKKAKDREEAMIKLAIFDESDQSLTQYNLDTISSKRRSGFPVLEKYKEALYLAYTQVKGEATAIHIKKITW